MGECTVKKAMYLCLKRHELIPVAQFDAGKSVSLPAFMEFGEKLLEDHKRPGGLQTPPQMTMLTKSPIESQLENDEVEDSTGICVSSWRVTLEPPSDVSSDGVLAVGQVSEEMFAMQSQKVVPDVVHFNEDVKRPTGSTEDKELLDSSSINPNIYWSEEQREGLAERWWSRRRQLEFRLGHKKYGIVDGRWKTLEDDRIHYKPRKKYPPRAEQRTRRRTKEIRQEYVRRMVASTTRG